jgi:hypothetical protein
VLGIDYARHKKQDSPDTFRVTYMVGGWERVREWVCFDHENMAPKACGWWRTNARRGSAPPASVSEALERTDELRRPQSIVVMENKKGFLEVIKTIHNDVEPAAEQRERKFEWHPEEEIL